MAGTPDGSRPGIFYFNSYDLPSRTTPGMETLYLHEAVPGHHFQISLAQENDELPNFLRFDGNTAYVEGWALYSERSEEHTSELQSLMRISYAVFCLKKKNIRKRNQHTD